MIKSCNHLDIFKLYILTLFVLFTSCKEPNLPLTDEETDFLELFANKSFVYKNSSSRNIQIDFCNSIDTTIFDNRGLFNSFYDKTLEIKSTKKKLHVALTKSTLGSTGLNISLFQNILIIDFERIKNENILHLNEFETNKENPLDYIMIDESEGITEFKFAKDSTPYKLVSSISL